MARATDAMFAGRRPKTGTSSATNHNRVLVPKELVERPAELVAEPRTGRGETLPGPISDAWPTGRCGDHIARTDEADGLLEEFVGKREAGEISLPSSGRGTRETEVTQLGPADDWTTVEVSFFLQPPDPSKL